MKRVALFMVALVIFLAPAFAPGALAKVEDGTQPLYRIELRNRTGQAVVLTLIQRDGPNVYRLSAAAEADVAYTVKAGSYDQTTYACGETATGTLQVAQQLRLTFTPCAGPAPNAGAPGREKVHLTDTPAGIEWRYQYGPERVGLGPFAGGGAGTCTYTAESDVTIYSRPDTAADVFSTQGAGFSIQPSARTATGWLGFEPGVAQAANIGVFRLRWLAPHTGTLTGNCGGLPVAPWVPRAGICYFQPMMDTNVRATPDNAAALSAVLHLGEFAQMLGENAGGDWAKVDLGPGNTGSHASGWVESSALNLSGPCSGLPTITP